MKQHELNNLPEYVVKYIKVLQAKHGLPFHMVIREFGMDYIKSNAQTIDYNQSQRNFHNNKTVHKKDTRRKRCRLSNFGQERVRPYRKHNGDEYRVDKIE